ncbi:MAG: hypothetical protein ABJN69_16425 [Hellea sp.]
MNNAAALDLNSQCYCWPVKRESITDAISKEAPAEDMAQMLSERLNYFASTSIFLSPDILRSMTDQVKAIEGVIKLPAYAQAAMKRAEGTAFSPQQPQTPGAFMGYDFHITEEGPRLIEINSNAGGAFIVNMIETAIGRPSETFNVDVASMFQAEWMSAGRSRPLRSIAIVDDQPAQQYHYPDMCLAKTLLEKQGLTVIITDPADLRLEDGKLYHGATAIDLVYNRLTDFDLQAPQSEIVKRAYLKDAAVVTPAPHHHALYADKRNLILLSDQDRLAAFGASQSQLNALQSIPSTEDVTPEKADRLWGNRRQLFFKPQGGFGSRGAFRGAKLTKKVWGEILEGGYIAQELIAPPMRAVTVDSEEIALKFDVRVYTYAGSPLLWAARIYQGQTTNLRTPGGGLAAIIPVETPNC